MKVAILLIMMITNCYSTEVYICSGSGARYRCNKISSEEDSDENNINYWESDGFKENSSYYSANYDDSDKPKHKTETSDGFDWTKYIFRR